MTRLDTALARIADLRALAQQATPGPWLATANGWLIHEDGDVAHATTEADAAHLAAWSPTFVLDLLDAAEATLRLHGDVVGKCWSCCAPWPCATAARWLAAFAPEEGRCTCGEFDCEACLENAAQQAHDDTPSGLPVYPHDRDEFR